MNTYRKIFLFFFITVTSIRVFYAAYLGLGDDEAYYWEWGQHLDLSYFDHPPITAWLARLTSEVFGHNGLGVRAAAVFCSSLFTILLYLTTLQVFARERIALFSTVLVSCIPIFAAGAFMMVPDSPLALFWMLALYLFSIIISSKHSSPWLWYALGITFGLGLLSKYNMILLPLCVLIFLVFSREHRFWLKRKEPYIALLVGLLLFLPVIYWNLQHDFSSFAFQFSDRHKSKLTWTPFLIYTAGQFGYLSPFIFVAALSAMILLTKRCLRSRHPFELFLLSFSVPYFLLLSIGCSLSPTAKPHWPLLGYIPALMYCAAGFDAYLHDTKRPRRIAWLSFSWTAFAVSLVLSIFLYIQSVYQVVKVDSSADATNELYGWDIVGRTVDSLLQQTSAPDSTFVFATRYNIASQVAFYMGGRNPVYSIGPRREQQDFWGHGTLDKRIGHNGIFVRDERYRTEVTELCRFERIAAPDTISIFRGNRLVKKVFITQCYNYLGPQDKM